MRHGRHLAWSLALLMPTFVLAAPPKDVPLMSHGIPDLGQVADSVIAEGESRTVREGDLGVVAVKGHLTLAGQMKALTILVYPSGTLTMKDGTTVTFTDQPIDTKIDPEQWGHGIVVFGKWFAEGSSKTPYARATAGLAAGATQLTLARDVENWKVGDRLAVPATQQQRREKNNRWQSQSEVVTITAIDGRTVTFEPALEHDHAGIAANPFGIERFPHIANLSRSIVLKSENPDGVRAHTVVTGDANAVVKNVRFAHMGRTSADKELDNTIYGDDGEPTHIGTNQIAKYPWHTHHLHGAYDLIGCVVEDGRKWAITIHATDCGFCRDNVVYHADGAGIVTEDGTEIENRFSGNLVIRVDGGFQRGDKRAGVTHSTHPVSKRRQLDTGADGSGFWLRGPGNYFTGNFAYDAAGYGFNFNGYYRKSQTREGNHEHVRSFKDNEAAACLGGFWATWSQSGSQIDKFQRQVFEDFLAWHCSQDGVQTYHEANVTLKNFTVVGDPAVSSTNQGSHFVLTARRTVGMNFGNASYENFNLQVFNPQVCGCNIGLMPPTRPGEDSFIESPAISSYVGIAYEKKADPTIVPIRSPKFLPTEVRRLEQSNLPERPTPVFDEEVQGEIELPSA